MQLSDEFYDDFWKSLDFDVIEDSLNELQVKIARAENDRNTERVKRLQDALVTDTGIKCLAIRHVTSVSKTPGVDGEMLETDAKKARTAMELDPESYKAEPMRMFRVESGNNGKIRNCCVPTFRDRAMSVLFAWSLSPVEETTGDKYSFAFRKGRAQQDALEYAGRLFKGTNAPEWVVYTDIHAYYASIEHGYLMNNIPMNKAVLDEMLNCGVVMAGHLFEKRDTGITEGASLSPILGNMVLDGIAEFVKLAIMTDPRVPEGEAKDLDNGKMIRYADDIIVSARSKISATVIYEAIISFIRERGLELNTQKSKIVNIKDGFTFLSHTYIKKDGVLYSYPSKSAIDIFKANIHDHIVNYTGSKRNLIKSVNERISGFCAYHKYCDCDKAFRELDDTVNLSLLEAMKKRHPKMSVKNIVNKYWYKNAKGESIYCLLNDKSVHIRKASDYVPERFIAVNPNKNPFLDENYMTKRRAEREQRNIQEYIQEKIYLVV